MNDKFKFGYYSWAYVLLLVIVGCKKDGPTQKVTEAIQPIESLEQIELQTLSGVSIDWNDYKGKVVFINFWATWCGPCIKEMPSIDRLSAKLENDNIVFLFATEESKAKIEKFQIKFAFDFSFVQQQTNLAQLEILALPTTFIFDKNGKLVFRETNVREWDNPENEKYLVNLMND